MAKTNLTLQLEVETVLRAKVLAAQRGTSVSALVARTLERLVEEDERYASARARALELMAAAGAHATPAWTRDELHER
jgi:hypothetical protein